MVDTARSQSAQGSAPNSAQGGRSNKKGKGRASSNTSRGGANSNRRGKPPRDSSSNQQQVVEDTDGSFPAATRVKRSFLPDFEPAETDEGCFICAEPVLIYALPSCGHKTCHVCFVRLRALYKKTSCTFCNQEFGNLPVVFTRDPAKQYADFAPLIGVQSLTLEETNPATQQSVKLLKGGKDDKLGIHFDDPELHQLTLALLAFNCPDPGCKVDCKGWQDLKMHAKSAHQRSLWYAV